MVTQALETVERQEDILAKYLPAILRQDPFLAGYLRIFDAQIRPLLQMLDSIGVYFDPKVTPAELLPWLAGWVGEGLPQTWPEAQRRSLIAEAAATHRARGTKKGLKHALELMTGCEVLITENTAGLRLDADAKLGVNTSLQEIDRNKIHIVIRNRGGVDLEAVNDLVDKLKPAHTEAIIRTLNE
jgi:phage tail-like protein